jgi:hypothetical protein
MGQRKRCKSCGRPFHAERSNYVRCDDCRAGRPRSSIGDAQRVVTAIGTVTSLAAPHAVPIFGAINAVGSLYSREATKAGASAPAAGSARDHRHAVAGRAASRPGPQRPT